MNVFCIDYDPTIEDSYRKKMNVDGISCLLDILDTSGKAEYSSMQDQWMREGNCFLLVYSITCQQTLDECIVLREKVFRAKDDKNVPIVLVGNKRHLEDQREVRYKNKK